MEKQGFLELIYGTLFDPVVNFKRIAGEIPVAGTVLIFSLVKICSLAVAWYMLSSGGLKGMDDYAVPAMVRSLVPVFIAGALVYEYIKWFVYSGILHLLADLAGGSGRAAGVLVATGLASLPSLLLLPVQILTVFFRGSSLSELINFLVVLAALVWGFILVVIGIREIHRFSTGTAVLVALVPAGIIVLVLVVFIVLAVSMLIPMAKMMY